jgi:hypothetical protein
MIVAGFSFGTRHSGLKYERSTGREPQRVASVRHDPNLAAPGALS